MLVEYTSISTLSENELAALKAAVMSGAQLEGQQYFSFGGKTFSISEITSAKRMWEHQWRGPGQQLNG